MNNDRFNTLLTFECLKKVLPSFPMPIMMKLGNLISHHSSPLVSSEFCQNELRIIQAAVRNELEKYVKYIDDSSPVLLAREVNLTDRTEEILEFCKSSSKYLTSVSTNFERLCEARQDVIDYSYNNLAENSYYLINLARNLISEAKTTNTDNSAALEEMKNKLNKELTIVHSELSEGINKLNEYEKIDNFNKYVERYSLLQVTIIDGLKKIS